MNKVYALTTNEMTDMEREHAALVRKMAGECVVILKNDGVLPLTSKGKVALYGDGARHTVKGGTGSGDVNSRFVVNIDQGLREEGFEVTSDRWLDGYDAALTKHQNDYIEKMRKLAEELNSSAVATAMFNEPCGVPKTPLITKEDIEASATDTAIYVISRDSGEGNDRKCIAGDYLLTEEELANIRMIASEYDKTIVLLNVGGVIDTSAINAIEGVNALVNISQLGNIGGNIVAEVLSGKSDPSGRLTDTWAKSYEDYPFWKDFSHNNGNTDDEYYKEGIYIGYRYFDAFGIEPAYPFGFGLGYTVFEQKTTDAKLDGSTLKLTVEVTNKGDYAGKEVVQVYVSAPKGRIDKPYQELRAFAKTNTIAPGATETITVDVDMKTCASFDTPSASRILEAGEYLIRVGKDSRDTTLDAIVTVGSDIKVEQLKNLFSEEPGTDALTNPGTYVNAKDEEDRKSAFVLELDPSSIVTRTVEYSGTRPVYEDRRPNEKLTLDDVIAGRATIEELTAQLTVKEMATLCVGSYEKVSENVVGAASMTVPGAAAETVIMEDRKIPRMILADGPAGLRLQPHFKTNADGILLPGGEVFGMSYNPFPEDTPADAKDYYQHCTAIPIATALAQSWNMDLVKEAGRIVGEEMKRYFVHFWLAPGMNIHRNPLCGRNFEYYSEDPMIAGKCAAADTLGVQSYSGQGTTIKHFACNNQEVNRMFSNSHVSEKALREIYLRGFEIAIKDSKPYSIMTSYNLLNGTHTANRYDLIQNAARDEWGFDGVVMTDWFTSQDTAFMGCTSEVYPISSSVECIRAGNDWQMPGCLKNITDIEDAIADGSLSLGDLQFCVNNILKMAVKCNS